MVFSASNIYRINLFRWQHEVNFRSFHSFQNFRRVATLKIENLSTTIVEFFLQHKKPKTDVLGRIICYNDSGNVLPQTHATKSKKVSCKYCNEQFGEEFFHTLSFACNEVSRNTPLKQNNELQHFRMLHRLQQNCSRRITRNWMISSISWLTDIFDFMADWGSLGFTGSLDLECRPFNFGLLCMSGVQSRHHAQPKKTESPWTSNNKQ